MGDYLHAIEHYCQARRLHRRAGNRRGEANALGNIGIACRHLGRLHQALRFLERALDIHTQAGDVQGVIAQLIDLANVHSQMGKYEEALNSYEVVWQLCRKVGDVRGEALALMNSATSCFELGRLSDAMQLNLAATRLYEMLADRRGQVQTNLGQANTLYRSGKLAEAIDAYGKVIAEAGELSLHHIRGIALWNMGLAYRDIAEDEKAIECLKHALDVYEGFNIKDDKVDAQAIHQQLLILE